MKNKVKCNENKYEGKGKGGNGSRMNERMGMEMDVRA